MSWSDPFFLSRVVMFLPIPCISPLNNLSAWQQIKAINISHRADQSNQHLTDVLFGDNLVFGQDITFTMVHQLHDLHFLTQEELDTFNGNVVPVQDKTEEQMVFGCFGGSTNAEDWSGVTNGPIIIMRVYLS